MKITEHCSSIIHAHVLQTRYFKVNNCNQKKKQLVSNKRNSKLRLYKIATCNTIINLDLMIYVGLYNTVY